MDGVFYFLLAGSTITGAVVGSFLNVAILRGARGETLWGRSRCEACKRVLSPLELMPILSYVLQKGRCRSCGTALLIQYPIVEGATALAYAAAAYYLLSNFTLFSFIFLILSFVIIAAGITIFIADLKYYTIPNGAILILLFAGIAATAARSIGLGATSRINDVGAAIFFGLFFAALWYVSKEKWMGFGDIKLVFATSLVVGFPASLVGFLFSFWLGAAVSVLLLASGKKRLRDIIPFGPYILVGMASAFFFSQNFMQFTGLYMLGF